MRDVKTIDETTHLNFKDFTAQERWSSLIENGYFIDQNLRTVMNFARRWAKMMQYIVRHETKNLTDIIGIAAHEATIESISESQRNQAAELLSEVWEFGSELSEWLKRNGGDVTTAIK